MKQTIIILFLLAMVVCYGCDPMRRINMNNNTSEEAQITWFIKEDSVLSSPLYISNSKEFKLQIPPQPESGKIKMSFGIGSWTPALVTSIVDDLDSVVIKWDERIAVIKETEDIRNFLLARRKGWDKSKIYITLKEDE